MHGRIRFNCLGCRKPTVRIVLSRSMMCEPCKRIHRADSLRATSEVSKAIRAGELDRADTHRCVDCGKQASHWEHRDYLYPLRVEPVCRGCNFKRPTAYCSIYRPVDEVERPAPFVKSDRRRVSTALVGA